MALVQDKLQQHFEDLVEGIASFRHASFHHLTILLSDNSSSMILGDIDNGIKVDKAFFTVMKGLWKEKQFRNCSFEQLESKVSERSEQMDAYHGNNFLYYLLSQHYDMALVSHLMQEENRKERDTYILKEWFFYKVLHILRHDLLTLYLLNESEESSGEKAWYSLPPEHINEIVKNVLTKEANKITEKHSKILEKESRYFLF